MNAVNERARIHISLNVGNIERSVGFYEAFFGEPAHKRRPGYANFDLWEPALKLALQEHPPTPGAGSLGHLGIQVATREQVDAARKRLIEARLATFDEGDTTCCYARQDKIWATDPDGNQWEVYVLLDDMLEEEEDHTHEPERESAAVCCSETAQASPCCTSLPQ